MDTIPQLTVAMIVHNERARIVDAIVAARKYAGKILVIDQGSTDDTALLAAPLADKFVQQECRGFNEASFSDAIFHTDTEWILLIDPDERLTREAIDALPSAMRRADVLILRTITRVAGLLTGDVLGVECFKREYAGVRPIIHSTPMPVSWATVEKLIDAPAIVSEKTGKEQHEDNLRYKALAERGIGRWP